MFAVLFLWATLIKGTSGLTTAVGSTTDGVSTGGTATVVNQPTYTALGSGICKDNEQHLDRYYSNPGQRHTQQDCERVCSANAECLGYDMFTQERCHIFTPNNNPFASGTPGGFTYGWEHHAGNVITRAAHSSSMPVGCMRKEAHGGGGGGQDHGGGAQDHGGGGQASPPAPAPTPTPPPTPKPYEGKVYWSKGSAGENCMAVCGGLDQCIESLWPQSEEAFKNIAKKVSGAACSSIGVGDWAVNPGEYVEYDNACYWKHDDPETMYARCRASHFGVARYCPCKSKRMTEAPTPGPTVPPTLASTLAPTRPSRRRCGQRPRCRSSRRRKGGRRRRSEKIDSFAGVKRRRRRRRRGKVSSTA